jgi:hypothetical protein
MSYSWSNDPTKSAIHATASRQASERGKQPINVLSEVAWNLSVMNGYRDEQVD